MKQVISGIVSTILLICLSTTLHATELNEVAPNCDLPGFEPSQSANFEQFRGKVVYVDFWASWCPPCLRSFPFMNRMTQQYGAQDLEIIAVNMDEERDDAIEFLERSPTKFRVVADTKQECAQAFEVKAMPSSYIIDRKGKIRHIHLGFKTDETEELQTVITQLLAENVASK